MVKWIFFDVGNVIFNDDSWMAIILERIYEAILLNGHLLTIEEFFTEREKLIIEKQDGQYWRSMAKKYIGEDRWHNLKNNLADELEENYLKYNILFPEINLVLEKLFSKYRLAIAANQTVHCQKALKQVGLLKYFDVLGISEQMGIEKPSCKFFEYLLGQAKCSPGEAIMIGDRIDNDIFPAKKMGIRTIWLRLELQNKGWQPQTDFAKRYFESMARTPLTLYEARSEEERPDMTVSTIKDICEAVETIDNMNESQG